MTEICDAYSGGCATVPPSTETSTRQPESLPTTGVSYGEVILVAGLLILIGVVVLYLTRRRRT